MNRFHDIGYIIDTDCLTPETLEKVSSSIKRDLPFTASQSTLRMMVFNELFALCANKVLDGLKRKLAKDEVLFIIQRIDVFLTARGYD